MLEILLIVVLTVIFIIIYKKIGEWAISKVDEKEAIFAIGFMIAILLSIFTDIICSLIN